MRAALLRPAQVPGSYIASASQVLVSALVRRYGLGSLAHRAGSAVACGSAWSPCSWQLWHSPATAKLHNAALLSVSASQSQAPFVAATASRPLGESNRRYAKLPSLERSYSRRRSPFASRTTRRRLRALAVVVAPGHQSGAARIVLVSGLRPVMECVPPPTLVLRRCAASALRAGLPVRPPWGLPQPARLLGWLCYRFCSCSRT